MATSSKDGSKLSRVEAGRRGGLETVSRYGSEHMSEIGYAGYLKVVELHFYGDPALHRDHLCQRARLALQRRAVTRLEGLDWEEAA